MSKKHTQSPKRYQPATQAVRAGVHRTNEQEHSEAIFLTSSFVFDSAQQAADRFSGAEEGNVYSRFTNPTVRSFEERLAAMEGGDCAVATSSGMSAITAMCMGLLSADDHIVVSNGLFGTTKLLFTNIMARFGIHIDFVDQNDFAGWEQAIKPKTSTQAGTRFIYFETPTNPLTECVDIRQLSDLAHGINPDVLVAVDNCFCSPALQKPLELGADIVIHSATKYLDGQGRCVGGAVIGDAQNVGEKIFGIIRTAGACMSPFNAWVFLRGLETLDLRMQQSSRNAQALAEYLQESASIDRVYYPGLTSHPQNNLVGTQQRTGGAILSFDVKGGQAAAWRLIDSTELYSITANLGDTRSTITHPSTTTHGRWSAVQRLEAGLGDGLIRIAVGLEDIEDLIADIHL